VVEAQMMVVVVVEVELIFMVLEGMVARTQVRGLLVKVIMVEHSQVLALLVVVVELAL
jgi:hypothetical protein